MEIQPRLKKNKKKKLPELVWSSRGDVVGHAEEEGKGWWAGGGVVWVSDDIITARKKVEAFQIANRQFPFSSCAPHFFRPHFPHFFSAAREEKKEEEKRSLELNINFLSLPLINLHLPFSQQQSP